MLFCVRICIMQDKNNNVDYMWGLQLVHSALEDRKALVIGANEKLALIEAIDEVFVISMTNLLYAWHI